MPDNKAENKAVQYEIELFKPGTLATTCEANPLFGRTVKIDETTKEQKSVTIAPLGKKEITASRPELKGKENAEALEATMSQAASDMTRKAQAFVAQMDPEEMLFRRGVMRKIKKGQTTTLVFFEPTIKPVRVPSLPELAAALGKTEAEIVELIKARQEKVRLEGLKSAGSGQGTGQTEQAPPPPPVAADVKPPVQQQGKGRK